MKQNGLIRILATIHSLIFLLLLIIISLRVITLKNNLTGLALSYIKDNTLITEDVINTFKDIGLSKSEVEEIFTGEVQNITAKVMGDKLSVLFHHTEDYSYTEDMIRKEIKEITEPYGNSDVLTTYIMDMTGLSSMFVFDSPAAYRNSLYQKIDGNIDKILNGISTAISYPVIAALIVMNIILIVLIIFLMDNRDKFYIANIYLRPTVCMLAFSLGELVCFKNQSFFTNYTFKYIFAVAVISLIIEIFVFCLSLANKDKHSPVSKESHKENPTL